MSYQIDPDTPPHALPTTSTSPKRPPTPPRPVRNLYATPYQQPSRSLPPLPAAPSLPSLPSRLPSRTQPRRGLDPLPGAPLPPSSSFPKRTPTASTNNTAYNLNDYNTRPIQSTFRGPTGGGGGGYGGWSRRNTGSFNRTFSNATPPTSSRKRLPHHRNPYNQRQVPQQNMAMSRPEPELFTEEETETVKEKDDALSILPSTEDRSLFLTSSTHERNKDRGSSGSRGIKRKKPGVRKRRRSSLIERNGGGEVLDGFGLLSKAASSLRREEGGAVFSDEEEEEDEEVGEELDGVEDGVDERIAKKRRKVVKTRNDGGKGGVNKKKGGSQFSFDSLIRGVAKTSTSLLTSSSSAAAAASSTVTTKRVSPTRVGSARATKRAQDVYANVGRSAREVQRLKQQEAQYWNDLREEELARREMQMRESRRNTVSESIRDGKRMTMCEKILFEGNGKKVGDLGYLGMKVRKSAEEGLGELWSNTVDEIHLLRI